MGRINPFLPEVFGRKLKITLDEFERSCLIQLGLLEHHTNSERDLRWVLRNAVKVSRELSDARGVSGRVEKLIDSALVEIRRPQARASSADFNRRVMRIVRISERKAKSLGADE